MHDTQIAARGLTFDALVDGPDDGPLLLLLHGLPRNRWEWHHQIPAMAELGFRVVAPDLRGFCAGARPEGVEAYHVDEYANDALAIADALGHAGRPFHLMGTSIGSVIAWWLAAKHPDRIATLVGINIPHPGALAKGRSATAATDDSQSSKLGYMDDAAKPGNERTVFEAMLATQGVSDEESEPYRTALDSDEALRAVYHWYRAVPMWMRERLDPVPQPTLFIWPTGSANVAGASIEANADFVTGPYRLEIVENVHQPALQAAPERVTPLLLEHLREHALPAPFVPPDFVAPRALVCDDFRLEPLGPEHNERDHQAWMTSVDHIRSTPGFPDGNWPSPMSLADNLADLERHAHDFVQRRGFTYTVLDDADDVIGCLYIYPSRDPAYGASVSSWVRVSHAHLDRPLWQAVTDWLATDFPFDTVDYDPR